MNQERTGWPPGLLQDDSRPLSRWFASRPDARHTFKRKTEMTTNHTPGPWINDGAEISALPDPENSQSYIAPICVMDSEWHPDTAAANARLIAAAPELLVALRLALPHVLACAEMDDSLAARNDERGMHGNAAECRKAADMRRAAAQMIADAIAKAGGAA